MEEKTNKDQLHKVNYKWVGFVLAIILIIVIAVIVFIYLKPKTQIGPTGDISQAEQEAFEAELDRIMESVGDRYSREYIKKFLPPPGTPPVIYPEEYLDKFRPPPGTPPVIYPEEYLDKFRPKAE